jgi:hypothetical protein
MTPVIELAGDPRLVSGGPVVVEPNPHPLMVEAPPSLAVQVVHEKGRILVVERRTAIYGEGPTHLDAIRDFQRAIREHLDVLERQPELSPELADQLDYLRPRVRP